MQPSPVKITAKEVKIMSVNTAEQVKAYSFNVYKVFYVNDNSLKAHRKGKDS